MPRETLINALPSLPTGPGVYRMQDGSGKDLYIGKAKNIAKRVMWYTQTHRLPYRLQRMVQTVHHVSVVTTSSELEALLLEAQLIKQHQPAYNIVLKHSSPLLYLALSRHAYPRLMAKRSADTSPVLWKMGPFLSRTPLRAVMDMMQKSFLLRPCSDTVFAQRQRPCLQYFIHRCSAPCMAKISHEDYGRNVDLARQLFSTNLQKVKQQVEDQMKACANRYDFEQAGRLRDQYRALEHMTAGGLSQQGTGQGDILGWAYASGYACIHVVSCRDGASYGCETFTHPAESAQEGPEILSAFMQQFYTRIPPPARIIVPFEPAHIDDIRLLMRHHHRRVMHVLCPKRGLWAQSLAQANQRAEDALRVHIAQETATNDILSLIAHHLGLNGIPHRVEMYDNSHHQGTWAVGAMVVKHDNVWARSAYQTWDFPPCQDDYAMMRTVIQARFTQNPRPPDPDLIVIDGGMGQLSAVSHTLEALGLSHLPHVAIAKTQPWDTIFLADGRAMDWPAHHPVLRWIQALRDEAHRFAISTHRTKHRHGMTHSVLNTIPGLGPQRLKALHQVFPSMEHMKQATLNDLSAILPPLIAARLYAVLHPAPA